MKSKAILLLTVLVALFSIAACIYLYTVNQKLQDQIDTQNKLMEKFKDIESRINKGENDLLDELNKYMDGESFTVDGKTVSIDEFLKFHNNLRDSLRLKNDFYDYSQENYGVSLKRIELSDSTYKIVSEPKTKADSSEVLYKYFKDRLSYSKGTWTINTSNYESVYSELVDDHNKLNVDYERSMKEHIATLEDFNEGKREFKRMLDKYYKLVGPNDEYIQELVKKGRITIVESDEADTTSRK